VAVESSVMAVAEVADKTETRILRRKSIKRYRKMPGKICRAFLFLATPQQVVYSFFLF
jgi:hypothetical protein